jgi:hypothetical protein
VADDGEQRRSGAEQSGVRRAREGGEGGGALAVPTHKDRAATAWGRRQPVVTGVSALSAVSVVTTR